MYTASPILYYLGVCFKYMSTWSQYSAEGNILLNACPTPHFHVILVVLTLVISMVRDDCVKCQLAFINFMCLMCPYNFL